ncbi:MAG: T9SS type A sorting domain-containing protein [Saprospiraceae bacterium]|nr:T9SS type A sorting domain-containing protein [Saprospiraceae bacterium]
MDSDGDGVIDTAMGTVWASEFNQSSIAACGSKNSELKFRLDRISDGEPKLPADSASKLDFGCSDVGTHALRMYVLDPSGAWDFCEIILVVQVNGEGCGDLSSAGRLTGVITNELDRIVHGVDLTLTDISGNILAREDISGGYRFELTKGSKAYLIPYKDSEHINGVSTRDLILIQQHILGKKKVDTWYKKQAADVNSDGNVSVVDIVQLRKLILGMIDKLPENTSWRFFENSANTEQYYINPMRELMRIDFTGVKIGDLNLDSDPSRKAIRSAQNLNFVIDDRQLVKGESYQIALIAHDFNDIGGLQYTLSFDQSRIDVIHYEGSAEGTVENSQFNLTDLDEGWLTASWFDDQAGLISIPDGTELFQLSLVAKENAHLSDVLSITNKQTPSEAYDGSGQDLGISLIFTQHNLQKDVFELYQNVPNPFTSSTTIAFNVPEASQTALSIYDVTGRLLKVVEGFAAKGRHEWVIDRMDLPESGILYYKLETDKNSSVKKMILMAR